MVITSTTQWTIPLSSSSLSASSPPAPTRQSSVLGLKTCQLSPHPPISSSSEPHRHSHHQELHSSSPSGRLQGVDVLTSRRSAGSFRQLVPDDFFAKVGHDGPPRPRSPEVSRKKEPESKYDGIALPWGSPSPFHALDAGMPSATALHGNLIDVHGDITADDVDLLPMPGLLSCPSAFLAATGYISHPQSPKSSATLELCSPESSDSSSKSSGLTVPNCLGLPPEFDIAAARENQVAERAGLVGSVYHANAPLTPPIISEHARCGGNRPLGADHSLSGKEIDNFADSFAGIWSMPAVSDYMLQDSESLASIFNVYPQNFHVFSSGEQSCFELGDKEAVHCAMDDLQALLYMSKGPFEKKGKATATPPCSAPVSDTFVAEELGESIILQAATAHGNPSNVASHPCERELMSSVKGTMSDGSAISSTISYASSLSHSKSYAESSSPLKNIAESINLKRPFSALDLAAMASSVASSGSKALLSPSKSGVTENREDTNRANLLLYELQNDCKLADNLHRYFAKEYGGNAEEELLPKQPPAKIRRKHGTAMDPQSVAARSRREKFSDRIRILQGLVPNGERLDTVSMLSQTLEYVKFLQHQVWHLYHGKDPALLNDNCDKWKDFVEAAAASAN